jgi:hypothetical protein
MRSLCHYVAVVPLGQIQGRCFKTEQNLVFGITQAIRGRFEAFNTILRKASCPDAAIDLDEHQCQLSHCSPPAGQLAKGYATASWTHRRQVITRSLKSAIVWGRGCVCEPIA